MRRTTSHTSLRLDGLLGDVTLVARGRDLFTGSDGRAALVAEAGLDATIAFVADRKLTALEVDPPLAAAAAGLVGSRVSGGFRRRLDEAMPGEDTAVSLRYQLLDDLPTVALIAGFPIAAAGVHPPRGSFDLTRNADICAGWATGGTILVEAEELGHVPQVTGPPAPSLDGPGDPDAWHDPGPLGPHAMRRFRRIDVWRPGADGPLAVEAFFRDSHVDGEGTETVVHEYLVRAELEPGTHLFRSCRAEVGVLPWLECPAAVSGAGRLEGTGPGDLRSRIRDDFVGTSTCTHLNDTLRALAALPHLAGIVETSGT
jgi:hypothetical protein